MAKAGLRVSEVVALRRTHITWGGGEEKPKLLIVAGKGEKDRTVPIDRELVGWLRRWDSERYGYATTFFHTCRATSTGAVSSGKHSSLSTRTVQAMVRKHAEAAGLPVGGHDGVTPHVLRHTYATRLIRRGVALEAVRRLLGHADISTTQRYLHVTDPELEETIWQLGEDQQEQGSLDGQPSAEDLALARAISQMDADAKAALRQALGVG
jgi:site-specific recombinase XerD